MIGEDNSFKAAAHAGRISRIDEGSGRGRLVIYGTTRPAMGASPGGAPLATIYLEKPSGTPNPTTGTVALIQHEDGLITASGTVVWCRLFTGNGDFCCDMDAGGPTDSVEAKFSVTDLLLGGSVRLVACVLGG